MYLQLTYLLLWRLLFIISFVTALRAAQICYLVFPQL